jgi:hypothetical protein
MTNPLVVASVQQPTNMLSGIWIAEDIEAITDGVRSGNWIETSLGAVGATFDGLSIIDDPFGAALQYIASWAMEHIKPLTDALNWLAGDPAAIAGNTQTWRNVSAAVAAEVELLNAADSDLSTWNGPAADAYRAWAQDQRTAIAGLASACETMATIVECAGFVVAAVRIMVRDLIAVVVAHIIDWLIELAASGGFAAPLVVEQVATTCAATGARIARMLKALMESLRRLFEAIPRLLRHIGDLRAILRRLGDHPDAGRMLRNVPDDITRNGAKIHMTPANVLKMAEKWGVDFRGIRYRIDKVRGSPGGETLRNQVVILGRDAFIDEEQLARTLFHERYHVQQLRNGMPFPDGLDKSLAWERDAYRAEQEWWDNHPFNPPGGD